MWKNQAYIHTKIKKYHERPRSFYPVRMVDWFQVRTLKNGVLDASAKKGGRVAPTQLVLPSLTDSKGDTSFLPVYMRTDSGVYLLSPWSIQPVQNEPSCGYQQHHVPVRYYGQTSLGTRYYSAPALFRVCSAGKLAREVETRGRSLSYWREYNEAYEEAVARVNQTIKERSENDWNGWKLLERKSDTFPLATSEQDRDKLSILSKMC